MKTFGQLLYANKKEGKGIKKFQETYRINEGLKLGSYGKYPYLEPCPVRKQLLQIGPETIFISSVLAPKLNSDIGTPD
jgi:hypothetical protein